MKSVTSCVICLSVAVVLGVAAPASAVPVQFDASQGSFVWQAQENYWDSGGWEVPTYLDITQSATQAGTLDSYPSHQLGKENRHPRPNLRPGWQRIAGMGKSAIACADPVTTWASAGPSTVDPVQSLSFSTLIGPGLNWKSEAYTQWIQDPSGFSIPSTTFLTPGSYIGVRLTLADGIHYGWIGGNGWGYETESGVAVAAGAPEPSFLALPALAALPMLRRQRHPSL
jgi:MYXO-CTERM domain-containing protein